MPTDALKAGNIGPVIPKFEFYNSSVTQRNAETTPTEVKTTHAPKTMRQGPGIVELKFNGGSETPSVTSKEVAMKLATSTTQTDVGASLSASDVPVTSKAEITTTSQYTSGPLVSSNALTTNTGTVDASTTSVTDTVTNTQPTTSTEHMVVTYENTPIYSNASDYNTVAVSVSTVLETGTKPSILSSETNSSHVPISPMTEQHSNHTHANTTDQSSAPLLIFPSTNSTVLISENASLTTNISKHSVTANQPTGRNFTAAQGALEITQNDTVVLEDKTTNTTESTGSSNTIVKEPKSPTTSTTNVSSESSGTKFVTEHIVGRGGIAITSFGESNH